MWEMWFIYFTYDRKMFTLQTRFNQAFGRSDLSLSICRKEKGLHVRDGVWNVRADPLITTWDERYTNFNQIINCYHVNGTLAWSR